MIDKKFKMINLFNVIISLAVLILEFIPKSVIKALGPLSGPNHYNISYHSYFTNPADWNVVLMFAFIVAILTIIGLIFNILLLLKSKKALYITSLVVSLISFIISLLFLDGKFATVYNYFIMSLFLIQITSKFMFLPSAIKGGITKINFLNIFGVLPILVALILEWIPNSIRIVQKFNYSALVTFSDVEYSYFSYQENWISLMGFMIAILTFCILLFNFITFSKDKKGLCITQLVMSSVCVLCSIIILIMAGSSLTAYNIIIMLLFIVLIITQSIKLKTAYNSMDK